MSTKTERDQADAETVYVPFSKAAYEDLVAEARKRNKPMNKILQEALAVDRKVADVRRRGGKVILSEGRKRSELVIG